MRQRADAHVRGLPARPRCIARKVLRGHHHGGDVELHAAKLFGNHDGRQPQRGRLAHDLARHAGFVALDGLEVRLDLLRPELVHRARNREMLVAEVLER